jgi:hypothetical protein
MLGMRLIGSCERPPASRRAQIATSHANTKNGSAYG